MEPEEPDPYVRLRAGLDLFLLAASAVLVGQVLARTLGLVPKILAAKAALRRQWRELEEWQRWQKRIAFEIYCVERSPGARR